MTSTAGGRKRKSLSLRKKLEILDQVRDNPEETKINIAKRLALPYSTLTTIVAHEVDIRASASKAGTSGEKRTRSQAGKFADLDEALLAWCHRKRTVSGPVLQEQALILAKELKISDHFRASTGWVYRFKQRYGITRRSVFAGTNRVDEATVERWKNTDLRRIIKDYNLRDIYNADETGLFYNLLPSGTSAQKGGKRRKDRLTVLVTLNADGSDKLRPLVIGKSQKPRCFKGVKSFPTDYAANKRAWMTGELFKMQLEKLNNRMRREERKILLLLDNCAAHLPTLRFSNIELAFFPGNCSHLQPFDLGITADFKAKYRKMLVQRTVAELAVGEAKTTLNVLQAMQLTSIAWNQVKPDTIAKCFRKAGVTKVSVVDPSAGSADEEDDLDEIDEPENWAEVCAGLRYEDFVHYDEDLSTCSREDDDIVAKFLARDSDEDSDESDNTVEEVPVKLCEVLSALEITKRYVMSKVTDGEGMQLVSEYERLIYECSSTKKMQAAIDRESSFEPN